MLAGDRWIKNIKNEYKYDFELETAISNVIKRQESRGTVISVIDGVALIRGLKRVKSGETLEFIGANNEISVKGMALKQRVAPTLLVVEYEDVPKFINFKNIKELISVNATVIFKYEFETILNTFRTSIKYSIDPKTNLVKALTLKK